MARNCLALLLSFLLAAALAGCGGGSAATLPPPPQKTEFLYASSLDPAAGTSTISSFVLTPSAGSLKSVSSTNLGALAAGIVVSPSAKDLYASLPGLPGINTGFMDPFSISPTNGALTAGSAFSLTQICAFCQPVSSPGAVAITPNGKTLFYGSSTAGPVAQKVGALSVNPADGSLSFVSGAPFPADDMPIFVFVHPSGKFLYSVNAVFVGFTPQISSISCFSIDATGAIAPVAGSPFPAPPGLQLASPALDPSGKFLYLTSGTAASGIFGWSVDPTTGAITALPGSPFAPGADSFGLAFDRSGKFAYTSGGPSLGLSGFSVDSATGSLTPLTGSPFFSGATLVSEIVDPANSWLVAIDTTQKAIVAFAFDKTTGSLSSSNSPPPVPVPTPATLVIQSAP